MKKLVIAALVGSGLALSTGASARHVFEETFQGPTAEEDCERFLREFKKEGRQARKRNTGKAGGFNQDAKNLRCEADASDPSGNTFHIVG